MYVGGAGDSGGVLMTDADVLGIIPGGPELSVGVEDMLGRESGLNA